MLTVSLVMSASLIRYVHSAALDVLGSDYLRTARALGSSFAGAIWRHGLRNAAVPVVSILGIELATTFLGAVVVENVFALPGLGSMLVKAFAQHDYPVIQGILVLSTFTVLLIGFLADVVQRLIDPRLRRTATGGPNECPAPLPHARRRLRPDRGDRRDGSAVAVLDALRPGRHLGRAADASGAPPPARHRQARQGSAHPADAGRPRRAHGGDGGGRDRRPARPGRGLLAGFAAHWLDDVLAVLLDILIAFPTLLMAMLMVAAREASLLTAILAIGLAMSAVVARLTRVLVKQVLAQDYITASRTSGTSWPRIVTGHVLPNIWPTLSVNLALQMGLAVLAEASLSYLGLGAPPPNASWGRMLQEAQATVFTAPTGVIAPGVLLAMLVIGTNLIADGVRETADPTLRKGPR
ncbi:ABC transporter permease subunit [Streptosporangium lutulentum]